MPRNWKVHTNGKIFDEHVLKYKIWFWILFPPLWQNLCVQKHSPNGEHIKNLDKIKLTPKFMCKRAVN